MISHKMKHRTKSSLGVNWMTFADFSGMYRSQCPKPLFSVLVLFEHIKQDFVVHNNTYMCKKQSHHNVE